MGVKGGVLRWAIRAWRWGGVTVLLFRLTVSSMLLWVWRGLVMLLELSVALRGISRVRVWRRRLHPHRGQRVGHRKNRLWR